MFLILGCSLLCCCSSLKGQLDSSLPQVLRCHHSAGSHVAQHQPACGTRGGSWESPWGTFTLCRQTCLPSACSAWNRDIFIEAPLPESREVTEGCESTGIIFGLQSIPGTLQGLMQRIPLSWGSFTWSPQKNVVLCVPRSVLGAQTEKHKAEVGLGEPFP